MANTFPNDRVHAIIHFYDSETEVSFTQRRMICIKKKLFSNTALFVFFSDESFHINRQMRKQVLFMALISSNIVNIIFINIDNSKQHMMINPLRLPSSATMDGSLGNTENMQSGTISRFQIGLWCLILLGLWCWLWGGEVYVNYFDISNRLRLIFMNNDSYMFCLIAGLVMLISNP